MFSVNIFLYCTQQYAIVVISILSDRKDPTLKPLFYSHETPSFGLNSMSNNIFITHLKS